MIDTPSAGTVTVSTFWIVSEIAAATDILPPPCPSADCVSVVRGPEPVRAAAWSSANPACCEVVSSTPSGLEPSSSAAPAADALASVRDRIRLVEVSAMAPPVDARSRRTRTIEVCSSTVRPKDTPTAVPPSALPSPVVSAPASWVALRPMSPAKLTAPVPTPISAAVSLNSMVIAATGTKAVPEAPPVAPLLATVSTSWLLVADRVRSAPLVIVALSSTPAKVW